ncbi:MAG TPA: hypothetical protein VJN18_06000 [Polyangiaceae bacterium]|nr:hypothetical protein [Polyangiaceae bacterium]
MASGISAPSLGAVAHTLWLLVACGGHSVKPGSPAEGGAGGQPGTPPAGECSLSQGTFSGPLVYSGPPPPALAPVPDGLLTAWSDYRDVDFGLYAQALDVQGKAAASEQRLFSSGPLEPELSLSLSSAGLALAWSDQERLHVSLLDHDGTLRAADVWLSEPAQYTRAPRLAAAGERWGLVWQDGPRLTAATSRFALVGASGGASDPLILAPESANARQPQLCFNGQRFGVVWHDQRSGKVEVWFRIVDAKGKAVTTDRRLAALEGQEASLASIACERENFAIAWNERLGSDEYLVRLQRVDAQGNAFGDVLSWPGIFGALAFNGRELQLLRYTSFGASELWLERLSGGALVEQRLAKEFSGTELQLPLVAQPERSVMIWSEEQQLMTASFECPESSR